MKRYILSIFLFLMVVAGFVLMGFAQGNVSLAPQKEEAMKMFRFGKEAYLRGKYEEAKAYFRKALELDPKNQTAWTFYDLSSVMALGKKVEKQTELLATTQVPTEQEKAPSEGKAITPSEQAPKPEAKPSAKEQPKPEFKIMHDEGC